MQERIEPMNLQPTLSGKTIKIRPLLVSDFSSLYSVAKDPLIWEQHPQKNRYEEAVFKKYLESAMDSKGAVVIEDILSQQIIGASRFYEYNSELKRVTIGYTFLDRKYWGGIYNQELKDLMINYAFQHVYQVIFEIGSQNFRSRKAIEKIGAQLMSEQNAADSSKITYEIKKCEWINK